MSTPSRRPTSPFRQLLPRELKLWYLKRFDLFHGLDPEEIQRLDHRTYMRKVPPSGYVYLIRESRPRVYLLKEGFVEIGYRNSRGREIALDLLGPGSLFGTIGVGRSPESFARAVTEALICVMDEADFEALLRRHPALALRVVQYLKQQLETLELRIQDTLSRGVRARLARLLLALQEKFGPNQPIPLTHQEIANLVGCARETASLHLAELKKQGIIEYHRGRLRILSSAYLKALSDLSGH